MGISITASEVGTAFPFFVRTTLTCDATEGPCAMFPTSTIYPDRGRGFIGQHTEAMRDGWKETFNKRGRVFLCSACSGK